ncbi:MAG TPA: hypothetical protein VGF29_15325 [Hyphomicrobiaceae bacterium]|jgi:hypothetical protein
METDQPEPRRTLCGTPWPAPCAPALATYLEWVKWVAEQRRRIVMETIRSKLNAMAGQKTPVPGYRLDKKGKLVPDLKRLPVNIRLKQRNSKTVRVPIRRVKRT